MMATRREKEFAWLVADAERRLDERDAELLEEIAADRLEESLASGGLEIALGNLKKKRRLDVPSGVEGVDMMPCELARRPGLMASEAAQGVIRRPADPHQPDLGFGCAADAPIELPAIRRAAPQADPGDGTGDLFSSPAADGKEDL